MEDVLDLYALPLKEKEPVIGIDEKTVQLLDHLREPRPMNSKHCQRVDYQYARKGVVNIFVGVQPKGGDRLLKVMDQKTRVDFLEYLYLIFQRYSSATRIHVVLDNLSTHSQKEIDKITWLYPFLRKFKFHYTPTHASWLNVAELEIGLVERQCLKDVRFPSIEVLENAVNAWQIDRNARKVKIEWKYTKEKARKVFKIENNRLN